MHPILIGSARATLWPMECSDGANLSQSQQPGCPGSGRVEAVAGRQRLGRRVSRPRCQGWPQPRRALEGRAQERGRPLRGGAVPGVAHVAGLGRMQARIPVCGNAAQAGVSCHHQTLRSAGPAARLAVVPALRRGRPDHAPLRVPGTARGMCVPVQRIGAPEVRPGEGRHQRRALPLAARQRSRPGTVPRTEAAGRGRCGGVLRAQRANPVWHGNPGGHAQERHRAVAGDPRRLRLRQILVHAGGAAAPSGAR